MSKFVKIVDLIYSTVINTLVVIDVVILSILTNMLVKSVYDNYSIIGVICIVLFIFLLNFGYNLFKLINRNNEE